MKILAYVVLMITASMGLASDKVYCCIDDDQTTINEPIIREIR